MTQAPERPRTARSATAARLPQVRRDEGSWLPALLLAARTTAYGLIGVELVVLLLWALAGRSGSSAGVTLRLGLTFWAAAHHATVHLGSGHVGTATLGVTPYLLTALPLWWLHRGARRVFEADDGVEPIAFVPALAVCYGVLATAVALAARGPISRPAPAEAFVGAAVVAVVAAGTAALRVRGLPAAVRADVAAVTAGALRAAAVLLLGGVVLTALTVLVHLGDVTRTAGALHPGAAGVVGLVLLDLLVLPTLAVDGASVLTGPGFGVGTHTSVSVAGAHLSAVPALPVLAALPGSGSFPGVAWLLLAVPVVAGAVAGHRGLRAAVGARARLLRAASTGVAGGLVAAAAAALADGSAGPGRLAVTGPSPWQVGLAAAGELTLGALLFLAVAEVRAWRARR